MSIYFGNDTVNDLYVGLTPVSKGYVGTHLFYNGDSTIIDFTYEKYILNTRFGTLYNTKEVPVKSAILTGQTLVNMIPQDEQHTDGISNVNLTEGRLTWSTQSDWLKLYFVVNGKPNTEYIIKYQSINENVGIFCRPETTDPHSGWVETVSASNQIITTYDVGTFVVSLENAIASSDLWVQDFMIIEYQEGMENWDIPYFEGMGSVKNPVVTTTGKNIVGDLEIGGLDANGNNNAITLYTRSSFILLKKDTTYTFSLNGVKRSFHLYLYDLNKNFKVKVGMANEYTPEVDCYIRIFQMDDLDKALYQVEKGTIATPYEPYKSNILTVNEEVELRGIGGVQNTLDLMTGEVTERIEEIVLDGSESWIRQHFISGYTMFRYIVPNLPTDTSIRKGRMLCDKFNVENYINTQAQTREFITIRNGTTGQLFLNVSNEKANDVTALKEWLSQNPITVQYQLAKNVVKTVDLSVVDQDGNNTKLSSFEDITHVTVTSEGILPDVELEVATKNEEVLNTMSLRMDDISTTQANLNETVNTQSENVDATMIATTEIYEGLL